MIRSPYPGLSRLWKDAILLVLATLLVGFSLTPPALLSAEPPTGPLAQRTPCPSPTTYPLTVTDDRGRAITIPARPTRIVVAGTPLFSEILFDIGAGDRLVGVTDSPDNPPEAQNITKVGPSFQANVEQVIALRPNVVFGAIGQVRDALEAANLVVVTPIEFISHVSDIFTVVRTVGQVVDACAQSLALIGQISETIVQLESQTLDRDRPTVAFIFAFPNSPPFAGGRGSIESELLARAGSENVFSDVQGEQQVSIEALIARDPDFIFTDPSQIAIITGNPLFTKLKAVQADHIIGVKASWLTSTRVAEALQIMAQTLHPEAFR